jgi:hypothetical protein
MTREESSRSYDLDPPNLEEPEDILWNTMDTLSLDA